MQVTICGKRWNLRFVPYLGDAHGKCDSPQTRGKEIKIESGLKDREQLEVLLHEMMHAADWSKDEAFVEQFANDVSAALWKLGYRKVNH